MQCKQSYDATWNKSGGDRCPNLLLPNSNEPNPVRVNWESKFPENYGSLVELWNDWNKAYVQATFPRLLIRYEDMLWHGEKVLELIAECAGIPRRQPFSFRYGASKTHGHSGNLVTSLQKLLAPSRQLMTPRNAEFAQHQLNKELMELFQYTGSSSTTTTSSVESFSSMPMPRGRSPLPARQKPKFKGKWS